MPLKDIEKRKEYGKHYYLLNKEKIGAQQKASHAISPDKNRERANKYYWENREQIAIKVKIAMSKDGNKEKRAEYSKKYREKNKEKIAESKKLYAIKNNEKVAAYKKQYALEHKDEIAEYKRNKKVSSNQSYDPEYQKEYNLRNAEKIKAYRKKYYLENKDMIKGKVAKHRKDRPDLKAASSAKRKSSKLQRTPIWSDLNAIKDVYMEAQYFQLVVDHIIPLQGKLVSGLHVWDNLQLLEKSENCSKGNYFNPEKHVGV